MEFFSPFKTIEYNDKKIKNITARINIIKQVKNSVSLFQTYILKDGERAEDVAYKFYKDANLYWVVYILNDIDDAYLGWHLTDKQLLSFIEQKYGVNNVYSIHHYETTEDNSLGAGYIVNIGTPFSIPVTNYDYEFKLNEEKRKIKILKNTYLTQLLNEVKSAY